eukprot:Nitzschia sp. Nitz4//scaffold232_size35869//29635//30304//NITZ4_007814-RA/size35869-processed-gene-0.20-mRNA-1//-1//CDS//3329543351//7167//frame0
MLIHRSNSLSLHQVEVEDLRESQIHTLGGCAAASSLCGPSPTTPSHSLCLFDTMFRAFTRTQLLRAPGRADVELAMSKWWTKKRPAEGQITQSITQHEQQIVVPWLKTFPKKTIERAPSYIIWVGGSLGLMYGSIARADALTHAEDFKHRP